eukprot:TRINITY_DN1930_c0_g1_i1.p1 TRINITY_DN1930_c0_g1~~TRINITY_DN1930_c0_g1_i1.p1  ORF type:complete len:638 (-),score=167.89 TRINITY_DN1930_c0_g1_i1:16-1824(-)
MSKLENASQKAPAPTFEPAPCSVRQRCCGDEGVPASKQQSTKNSFGRSHDAYGLLHPILEGISGHCWSRVLLIVCAFVMACQYWKLRSQSWRMEVQEQDVEAKTMLVKEEQKQLRQVRQYLKMEKHQHEKEVDELRSAEEDLSADLLTERRHREMAQKQTDHSKQAADKAIHQMKEMKQKLERAAENVRKTQVDLSKNLLTERRHRERDHKELLTERRHREMAQKQTDHSKQAADKAIHQMKEMKQKLERAAENVRKTQVDLSKNLLTERRHRERDHKELLTERRHREMAQKQTDHSKQAVDKAVHQMKELKKQLAQAVETARQAQVRFKAAEARSIELQEEADQMALETLRQREQYKKIQAEKDKMSKENIRKQTLIDSIQKKIVDAKRVEDELRQQLSVERSKVEASESLVHESNITLMTLQAELRKERAREKHLLSKMVNETSEVKHLRKEIAFQGHKLEEQHDVAAKYRERAKQEQARALAIEALRDSDLQTIEKLNAQLQQQVSDSELAAKKHAEEHAAESGKDADLIRRLQETLRAKGAEMRELRVKVQQQKLSEKDVVLTDISSTTQKMQDDDLLDDSLEPIGHPAGGDAGGRED